MVIDSALSQPSVPWDPIHQGQELLLTLTPATHDPNLISAAAMDGLS